MYRLMIVDDRNMERSNLVEWIEWDNSGFEMAGRCRDTAGAIRMIQESQIDVAFVITHSYVTVGWEVTKYLRDYFPRIKVMMVGEYRDYDYVCTAMRCGVCEYLPRPVGHTELAAALERVKHLLDVDVEKIRRENTLPFELCQGERYHTLEELGQHLVNAVTEGRTDEVYALYEDWFGLLRGQHTAFLFHSIMKILHKVYHRYQSMGIQLEDHLKRETVLQRLDECDFTELFPQFGKLLLEFCRYVTIKKENSDDTMIEHAKNYIQRHLAENFSIDDVAKSVFLSNSYFSREFKNQTGENVVNYVIRCRMEQAIALFREGKYSLTEVCGMVGYNDIKYFHRSFKKYTGYTVKEYQKLMG